MYKVLDKKIINENVVLLKIAAEKITNHVLPGQFVIIKLDEYAERIPLTISDFDKEEGSITVIFQTIGVSTMMLGNLNVGDEIESVLGPLGKPTEFDGLKKVCVIGGGVGLAIAYPSAKHLHENGVDVTLVAGFRNQDLIILEQEAKNASSQCYFTTDDGSNGNQGFVTTQLEKLIQQGEKFDAVVCIGPVIMMKFICDLTKKYGIKTIVSLNPIMIDGTGMCGCCRVTVDSKVKFACIDGPDFDGHLVDFDELMTRNRSYATQEKHACNRLSMKETV